jgi:hypothetical protein
MENVSALLNNTVPQGRAGSGVRGQERGERFADVFNSTMRGGDVPASDVRTGHPRNVDMPRSSRSHRFLETDDSKGTENLPDVNVSNEPEGTAILDMDVENAEKPQLAVSQDDMLRLVALLLGEDDDGDFLFALEQYILKTPKLLVILEDANARIERSGDFGREFPFAVIYHLIYEFAWTVDKSSLPAELKDIGKLTEYFNFPMYIAPRDIAAIGENILPTEIPVTEDFEGEYEQPELAASKASQNTEGAEIAGEGTARVTGFNIAAPSVNTVPAAVVPTGTVPTDTLPTNAASTGTVPTDTVPADTEPALPQPEGIAAEGEDTAVPGMSGTAVPNEAGATSGQTETDAGTPLQTAPVQSASAQPAQPAQSAAPVETHQGADVAKQILAERIIEQIAGQASRTQDVSVLYMELKPRFLGSIQLILEATADGMTARLRSDNGLTRFALNEHLSELKNALKEAGINMKDIEISETRIGTQLSDRSFQQDNGAFAEENQTKPGKLPAIASMNQLENAEPEPAVYAPGPVSGYTDGATFDYRA